MLSIWKHKVKKENPYIYGFASNMQFGDIIGQKEIKARLLNLVREDRLPHALMLFGPPGSGKRSLALALASYLSCSDRQENDACGRCPSCLKFSKLVHPDLHFVVPVVTMAGNSKPITANYIEQWRDAYLGNPYLTENQWYEALGAENKQGMIYVWESGPRKGPGNQKNPLPPH